MGEERGIDWDSLGGNRPHGNLLRRGRFDSAVPDRLHSGRIQSRRCKASPPATIDQVAWLAGYWRGEGLGGRCEEIWSQSSDGRMFGIFTLVKEQALVFSEAMTLVEREGSLVLRVKHFTPDFVGWEEKDQSVDFPLVRLGDREAYFNGLTFRRNADDTLSIYLVLRSQDKRTEHALRFERVTF